MFSLNSSKIKRYSFWWRLHKKFIRLKYKYGTQGGEQMIKLLVIADDFTGALDTGVQFSQQGANTVVTTNPAIEFSDLDISVEVLVINTESRYLCFEDAYERMRRIMKKAQQFKIPFIYKKVDSALRGNVSAEIKAILDSSKENVIPFLPAYPEINRVLIDGDLYINQVLVSQSIFSKDPYEPVTESNILKRLKLEAEIDARLIKGDVIPQNAEGLLVFDSQTDEDLERQMIALKNADVISVSIGCAGFAKVLASQFFPHRSSAPYQLNNPLVVICGSVNPITEKQIKYAEKRNYPRISLAPMQLLQSDYWTSPKGERDIQSYLTLMSEHRLVIFETLSEDTTKGIATYSEEKDVPIDEFRFQIGKSLGELVQALWERHSENTFLFTGGDTLFQSMKVLGINQIKPVDEVSAGVVVSTIEWQKQTMQVITKSGGFGKEDLFVEISHLTKKKLEWSLYAN